MASNAEDVEKAVADLPQDQLVKFRAWYEKFDSDQWDKRIEDDASSGKLDALADFAVSEHKQGKTKKL